LLHPIQTLLNRLKRKDFPVISAVLAALSLAAYLVHALIRPKLKTQVEPNVNRSIVNFIVSSSSFVSGGLILAYFINRQLNKQNTESDIAKTLQQKNGSYDGNSQRAVSTFNNEPPPSFLIPAQDPHASLPKPGAIPLTPLNSIINQAKTETLPHSNQDLIPIQRFWMIGVTSICLGFLAFAIYILNLSSWFETSLPIPSFVASWSCVIPQFCDLRFPPNAFPALMGILLAAVLFGWLVSRLPNPPDLTEIHVKTISFRERHLVFSKWHWLIIGVCIFLNAYIIYGSFTNQPIPIWIWLINLACFIGSIAYLAPAKNDWSAHTRWNLVYLSGLAALLIAIAGALASRPYPLVLGGGLAIWGLGSVFARDWRYWSTPERAERILLLLIPVAAFALMVYGSREWYWAVSEDTPSHWDYYEQAMQYATGSLPWPNINTAGVYGGTGALSSAVQAVSMVVFGVDAFAWRLSNYLLLAIATPAFYYFARQFTGRRGGLLTICFYASGHFLLSYSKTGFHTLQIIAVFAFTLAALAWASRHGSLMGFALAGLFLGLGFNTYGVARIYVWAAGIWLLVYCFPLDLQSRRIRWDRVAIWGVVGLAIILTALPILANLSSSQEQLSRTVFVQSDIAHNSTEQFFQIAANILYGSTLFLTSSANITFVYGAHADPISAGLIVLALAGLTAGWKNIKRGRVFLIWLIGGLTVFLSGLETYSYPSTNWMLALTPLYAFLAAIGLLYLGHIIQLLTLGIGRLHWIRSNPAIEISMTLAIGIIASLNFWISNDLGPRNLNQPPQNFIIQSAMLTEDRAGKGARVIAIIKVDNQDLYLTEQQNPLIPMIFKAYHIPIEHLALISPLEAYNDPSFCNVESQPAVIIMDTSNKYAQFIINRIQECWPDSKGQAIKDVGDREFYYRFFNNEAQALIRPLPGYWAEIPIPKKIVSIPQPGSRGNWEVNQPLSIATNSEGDSAVIDGKSLSVTLFNQDGQAAKSLSGLFLYPSAVGYDSHDNLLVLDAGAATPLTWFNADFQVIQQGTNLSSARGLFVAPDDSVYIAETGAQRIVHLSPSAEFLGEYLAPGKFGQPTSVSVSSKGWLAVGDPIVGKIFIVDPAGVIQNEYSIAPGGGTTVEKPGLIWLSDDNLLYTDPLAGRVILVQGEKILREWTGFSKPTGMALGLNNQVFILEYDKQKITTIEMPK